MILSYILFFQIDPIPIESETGSRKYACPYCLKIEKKRHHMESHIRSHTGEQPFQCPLCHKKFSRVDNCQRHIKSQSCLKGTSKKFSKEEKIN